jgi:hypothetical protein
LPWLALPLALPFKVLSQSYDQTVNHIDQATLGSEARDTPAHGRSFMEYADTAIHGEAKLHKKEESAVEEPAAEEEPELEDRACSLYSCV